MDNANIKPIEQKNKKRKTGVILIIIFLSIFLISSIIGISNQEAVIGPLIFYGFFAYLYKMTLMATVIFCIYGLLKKKIWVKKLSFIYFGYVFILSIVSFVHIVANKNDYIERFLPYLSSEPNDEILASVFASMFFMIIVVGLIIQYLYKLEDYFVE